MVELQGLGTCRSDCAAARQWQLPQLACRRMPAVAPCHVATCQTGSQLMPPIRSKLISWCFAAVCVCFVQVCLQKVGFFPGDDEMRWWQFGSGTLDALKTFQVCAWAPVLTGLGPGIRY